MSREQRRSLDTNMPYDRLCAMRYIACIFLVAACAADDAPERVAVRDSAGVTIVENSTLALESAPTWSLSPQPELTIGVLEGDPAYQLHFVGGGALMPDGRIAVLNSGTRELRFYDAAGWHLATVGGDGEGPGEFRGPFGLVRLAGDSLLVWDARLQRLSLFDGGGNFARTITLERAVMNPEFLGAFDDGSVAILDLRLEVPEQGFGISNSTIVRYHVDGSFADSLGAYPWMETGRIGSAENMLVGGRIFAPRSSAAIGRDELWFGTAAEPSVGRYDRTGQLTHIVRWDAGDRTATSSDRDVYLRNRFEDPTTPAAAIFRDLPMHERFPAYEQLGVDRSGRLWVKSYRRPGQEGPDTWLVFDPQGALAGRIELPEEMRVLEVAEDDRVLAVVEDELDVQRVVVYTLTRTES